MIQTVPKTVETGGTIYRLCGYTYFCAEEPASRGPAIERTATVEPDVATVVQEVNNRADRLIVSERGKTVRCKNQRYYCSCNTSSDMASMVHAG